MTPSRNETDTDHGARLTRYLETVWDDLGTTRGAWCRQHRIADSTVMRWSIGVEPDMRNYRAVAAALELPLLDILVIAGEVTLEKGDRPAPPKPRHTCRLDTALAEDNSVRPEWRQAVRALLDLEAGPVQTRRRRPKISQTSLVEGEG